MREICSLSAGASAATADPAEITRMEARKVAGRFAATEKTLEAFEELSGTFDPEGTRGCLAARDFWDVALSDE